jgi:uncharacterized protein (UPF0332 family)
MRPRTSSKTAAVLNPDHLFEQAEKLISPPSAGAPRQADLRRAVSTAYFALFHAVLTAAADEFVGATRRTTARYGLVYRGIDHRGLRDLCSEVVKQTPSARYARYQPAGGFGSNIKSFATALAELQEKRHAADYDPLMHVRRADAELAIRTARFALRRFEQVGAERREAFLSLLLFPPR